MTVLQDIPTAPNTEREAWFGGVGTTVPDVTLSPRKFIACVFMAGVAATGTLTAISPADAFALTTVVTEPSTMPALPSQPSPGLDNAVVARLLQRLRRVSGLSWGDVARALGVSRRTIHNWLGGARIAGVHLTRLVEFDRIVNATAVGTPEDTRARLLQPRSDGRSIFDDMALTARPTRRVPLSTVSVGDQLAPISGEPEVLQPQRRSALRGGPMLRRPRDSS